MARPDLPNTDTYVVRNCSIPAIFLPDPDELPTGAIVLRDVHVARGKITSLTKVGAGSPGASEPPEFDARRGLAWPCMVDIHCHLDKGQIFARAPAGDGSFEASLRCIAADKIHWNAADARLRMDFGLRCSFAHGSRAVRTHIDSDHTTAAGNWEVFAELRDQWKGRVELQGVSLVHIAGLADPGLSREIADRTASFGGIMGASTRQRPDLGVLIDNLFELAESRGLSLDLHVDETSDPDAAALAMIAHAKLRRNFPGQITVGHCCSLANQSDAVVERTLDLVAQAGLAVVSLPVLNLQLQDRQAGRTPRWRGVTLIHEMRARGIPVALGGDNVRDPLYPYGDHDMLAIYRDATRIGHLDQPINDWPCSVTTTPSDIMGLPRRRIGPGLPADFILFTARTYSELLSRPQSDRIVVRDGQPIYATLPDYSELDHLLTPG